MDMAYFNGLNQSKAKAKNWRTKANGRKDEDMDWEKWFKETEKLLKMASGAMVYSCAET